MELVSESSERIILVTGATGRPHSATTSSPHVRGPMCCSPMRALPHQSSAYMSWRKTESSRIATKWSVRGNRLLVTATTCQSGLSLEIDNNAVQTRGRKHGISRKA
jgi:hypothetical protein